MKSILPPIQTVNSILGEQKQRENTVYRETRHRVALPCEDGQLLFHTLTQELLLLESGETGETCRDELIKRWFLVPRDFDECRQADGVRQVAKLLKQPRKERTNFTILTTTDCNARCFYCYEKGIRRYAMTPETARDVGEYIVRVSGGEKVRISWFGGEPLYNPGVIDIICEVLRENGVAYSAILTSNGYLLDAETSRKAVADWHLKSVQITLDGTEPVYDRTKAYIDRGEESPFRRVLRNIETALEAGIEVDIRLNMDRANAEDLFVLADQLAERFGPRPKLFGRAALLGKFAGDIHAFGSAQEASDYQTRLQAKLNGFGMGLQSEWSRTLSINQCMADNDSCEVILPDGRILRCEHIRDSEVVGTIYDEARDADKVRAWKETVHFPECTNCELYPLCVNLKKCEWNRNGCPETRRNFNRTNMNAALLATYRKEKGSAGERKDETEAGLYTGGNRW